MVVCYFGSWAFYRPKEGKFTISNIDPKLCTHVVYAFAGLDETSHKIRSLDPNLDLQAAGGHGKSSEKGEMLLINRPMPSLLFLSSPTHYSGGLAISCHDYMRLLGNLGRTMQMFLFSHDI